MPRTRIIEEDYYAVIGVARDADQATIKKAYKKRARQYHPDLNPDDETAAKRFAALAEAYEVLSNPETRGSYDRSARVDTGGSTVAPPPAASEKTAASVRRRPERVFVGIVQGVEHYHYGDVRVCLPCGLGITLGKSPRVPQRPRLAHKAHKTVR